MNWIDKTSPIQAVHFSEINDKNIQLSILREDLLHATISGNKYRKLKYNLFELQKQKHDTLLTFGGAYSNHIAAAAAAGREFGFKTIGVIRGDELADKVNENPTLKFAKRCGMQFHFVSRTQYREKNSNSFLDALKSIFGRFYLLPEGGTNAFAVKGCEEILYSETKQFDYICCAVGTSGTISGIINASELHQKIIGFPALKDAEFLNNEIKKYTKRSNFSLNTDYHFGGYGKIDEDFINFVNSFKSETQIPLDPIYTGKMIFGLVSLIKEGFFKKDTKILAVHTGGLQGIEGMNKQLIKNNKTFLL